MLTERQFESLSELTDLLGHDPKYSDHYLEKVLDGVGWDVQRAFEVIFEDSVARSSKVAARQPPPLPPRNATPSSSPFTDLTMGGRGEGFSERPPPPLPHRRSDDSPSISSTSTSHQELSLPTTPYPPLTWLSSSSKANWVIPPTEPTNLNLKMSESKSDNPVYSTLLSCVHPDPIRMIPETNLWFFHHIRVGKDFLICACCYERYIQPVLARCQLDISLRDVRGFIDGFRGEIVTGGMYTTSGGGLEVEGTTCQFGAPRIVDPQNGLWVQSIRTGKVDGLVQFMKKRAGIICCSGSTPTPPHRDTIWYSMDGGQVKVCQACVEDYIIGPANSTRSGDFESHFRMLGKLPQQGSKCAIGQIPCIARLLTPATHCPPISPLLHKSILSWQSFSATAYSRLILPECSKTEPVPASSRKWYTITRSDGSVFICQLCYMEYLANTIFEHDLITTSPPGADPDLICCGPSHFPSVGLALGLAFAKRDFGLIKRVWEQLVKGPFYCWTGPYQVNHQQAARVVEWFGLKSLGVRGSFGVLGQGEPGFALCRPCYESGVVTCGYESEFERLPTPTHIVSCAFSASHPHGRAPLLLYLMSAINSPSFPTFQSQITRLASVAPCPKREAVQGGKWWLFKPSIYPNARDMESGICQYCWKEFGERTKVGEMNMMELVNDSVGRQKVRICYLYSTRMREKWLDICSKISDPIQGPKAIESFLLFTQYRSERYTSTVLVQKQLTSQQMDQIDESQMLGIQSDFYTFLDRSSAATNTGRYRYIYDGKYETPWGKMGENYGEQSRAAGMNAIMGNSGQRIDPLEMAWAEVE